MPHEVIMPALGMAQDTGQIVAWRVAAGDEVAEGDVLFEVETDKATMEVEAQVAGVISRILHEAGKAVPVGDVIAMIGADASDTGGDPDTQTAAEDAPDTGQARDAEGAENSQAALPEGHEVIMPALGMAQDTGLIVAWHKAPGDAVKAADILFEVETDKSTVEVEAGEDGYVAVLLAEVGEDAPVGEAIAVITKDKPDAPEQRSRKAPAIPAPAPSEAAQKPAAKDPAPQTATPRKAPLVTQKHQSGGRILASPKARRLAHEAGLDLARLVDAGYPQPYHASDIETLRGLKPAADATTAAALAAPSRLVAEIADPGFDAFAAWAAETADLTDPARLLAGLAGHSFDPAGALVAVETAFSRKTYRSAGPILGDTQLVDTDDAPDLILRDLRQSRITRIETAPEACPVISVTQLAGGALSVTLDYPHDALTPSQGIALISDVAGRLEEPLRHLL